MNRWTNESVNPWINKSMTQWISESMNQGFHESMKFMNELPLCWATSSLITALLRAGVPMRFVTQQYRVQLADSIFQKCSAHRIFLPFGKFWKCKSSSRYSPVRCLSTTFPDRGPHPLKQRPFFGDTRSQITRQTNIGGFRPKRVFIREFTRGWRDEWWCGGVVMWWCVWWVNHPHVGRASWAIKVTWFL